MLRGLVAVSYFSSVARSAAASTPMRPASSSASRSSAHQAKVEEAFHHLHAVADAAVEDQERGPARLRELGRRDPVARGHLVREAPALAVDEDRAGAAHGLSLISVFGADGLRRVDLAWSRSNTSAPTACTQIEQRVAGGAGPLAGAREAGEATDARDALRVAAVARPTR